MPFEFVRCGACGAGVKLDTPTEDDPFLPCPYCAHLMEPAEAPPSYAPPPVDPAPDTRTPEQKMNDARDAMFRNIFGEGDG